MDSKSNRRMTLSGIPTHMKENSVENRRETILPPTPTGGGSKRRVITNGRKSMIPRLGVETVPKSPASNDILVEPRRRSIVVNINEGPPRNDRRKSLVGGFGSGSVNKHDNDPRIVNDSKAAQQKNIRNIVDFLVSNGYHYPVSQKSLSRPSSKEFASIITFMLRMIDVNFQQGSSMKFEDEVALNFKCLGYPYTISKTALVAAGSAHTYPSLLAALTWLMERLNSKLHAHEEDILLNQKGTEFETIEELTAKSETAFFQYLGKSYSAFLTEDLQELDRMEAALSDRFLKDDELLEHSVERMTDVNASYAARIRELESESSELPTYEKKREDYAIDLEQFHDLIRQMNEHKATLEKKVMEKTIELKSTNERMDKISQTVDGLKHTIATQVLSVDDLARLESEARGLKEALNHYSAVKDQRRRNVIVHEEELVKICFEVDAIVTIYNIQLSELSGFSDLSSNLTDKKARFQKENLLEQHQMAIIGIDLENQIKIAVLQSHEELVSKYSCTKETFHDELDRKEHIEESYKVASAKYSVIVEKKTKSELAFESDRESLNETLSVRQDGLNSIDCKVRALRDPVSLEEQMAAFERQCSELERMRISYEVENIAKKRSILAEIRAACDAMNRHDKLVAEAVARAKSCWNEKREEVAKLVIAASNNETL